MSLYARAQGSGFASSSGGGGGGGGSSASVVAIATLYDPIDTVLPTSSPLVIDGVTILTGMSVLFSNLLAGNNEIYIATVSGSSISWAAQPSFSGVVTPVAGNIVSITQGTAFGGQVGTFNGTTWSFNNVVRYFNGTDYFEQDSLYTTTLADNTSLGTIFSVAFLGSQNIIVDYSILRGSSKEAGTINLTTDGTVVGISSESSYTANNGVTFAAVISGANLVLQYSTTSTGSAGTMKYSLKRWSDTAGGPAGPPSYSGGSSAIPAAGSNGNIQINSGGSLGANSNFSYDSINNLLLMGGKQVSILNTTTFLDNQSTPALLVSMPATFNSVILTYTTIRGTNVATGMIKIATDGVINIGSEQDHAESSPTGLVFSVTLSGGNININYTSTATGIGGTYKYSFERW